MSKSHKEVISQLKSQETTLSQIASSFPSQAAQMIAIADNIRTIGTCLEKAAEATDRIQVGITELQDMKKGRPRLLTHVMFSCDPQILQNTKPRSYTAKL